MAEENLCWVKYIFFRISPHRKEYVKKCEDCTGNDYNCKAYIPQSYFNKNLEKLIKPKGF